MFGTFKDYDMSVLYHSEKDNVVVNALSFMTMGSVPRVEKSKKVLVKMFIGWPD